MWYWHGDIFENYHMGSNTTQYKKIFIDPAIPCYSDFNG